MWQGWTAKASQARYQSFQWDLRSWMIMTAIVDFQCLLTRNLLWALLDFVIQNWFKLIEKYGLQRTAWIMPASLDTGDSGAKNEVWLVRSTSGEMGIHRVCYLVKWHDTKQTDLGKLRGWMKCRWKGARGLFSNQQPERSCTGCSCFASKTKETWGCRGLARCFIHPKFFW